MKWYQGTLVSEKTGEPNWGWLHAVEADEADHAAFRLTEHMAMYLYELESDRTLAIREPQKPDELYLYRVGAKATFMITVNRAEESPREEKERP